MIPSTQVDRGNRTEVISTEELCHEIDVVNDRINQDGLTSGPFQGDGHLVIESMAMKSVDAGVRSIAERMNMVVVPEFVESDKEIPEDKRTMIELNKIANIICECVHHNRLPIQPSGRRRQNASIGYKDVRGGECNQV